MDGWVGGGPLAKAVALGAPWLPWPGCQGWEDPGPLICLVPADPSPSMTATPFFRVYGVSLGTHLQDLGRDIALPIEACVMMLLSEGMKEEVGPLGAGRAGALGPSLCPQLPQAAPCWCCNPTIRAQVPRRPWPPVAKLTPPPT